MGDNVEETAAMAVVAAVLHGRFIVLSFYPNRQVL